MPGDQVDGMAVMRHWTATAPLGGPTGTHAIDEAEVRTYQHAGWSVAGPFASEATYRGAVEALGELEAMTRDEDYPRYLIRRRVLDALSSLNRLGVEVAP